MTRGLDSPVLYAFIREIIVYNPSNEIWCEIFHTIPKMEVSLEFFNTRTV